MPKRRVCLISNEQHNFSERLWGAGNKPSQKTNRHFRCSRAIGALCCSPAWGHLRICTGRRQHDLHRCMTSNSICITSERTLQRKTAVPRPQTILDFAALEGFPANPRRELRRQYAVVRLIRDLIRLTKSTPSTPCEGRNWLPFRAFAETQTSTAVRASARLVLRL